MCKHLDKRVKDLEALQHDQETELAQRDSALGSKQAEMEELIESHVQTVEKLKHMHMKDLVLKDLRNKLAMYRKAAHE